METNDIMICCIPTVVIHTTLMSVLDKAAVIPKILQKWIIFVVMSSILHCYASLAYRLCKIMMQLLVIPSVCLDYS